MSQKIYKTIFFGTPDFAVPVLSALAGLPFIQLISVVTQPDKPVGRRQTLTPSPIKSWSVKNNLPVWQPASLKNKAFAEQFKSAMPDVCIVVAYGRIIPVDLLDIPLHGWLNIHASLLPKYRGASPIQTAILNGERETGVTLMNIDAGLDTGVIIDQISIQLESRENFQTLHEKLSQLGATVAKKSLLPYLEGKMTAVPQDNAKATLTKIIDKSDGRIDWKKSAVEIDRQIRAYTPWPGAYCFLTTNKKGANAMRVKIISARTAEHGHELQPGQVRMSGSSLLVGCGQGSLELLNVQLEGKRPLPVRDFIKGYAEFVQSKLT